MPLFAVNCPRCNRPTTLGVGAQCVNVLNGGCISGFALPIQYTDGNSKYRDKYEKHATPPASGLVSGTYSWVNASGDYARNQEFALASGSVHLDTRSNHLFLFTAPCTSGPVANLFYGSSGTVVAATGVYLPLNQRPQNYHHWYSNYEPHFQPLVDGPGLIIEASNSAHSDYRVYRDTRTPANLLLTWDPYAQSGLAIMGSGS